jgi:hypothetical protein
MSLNIVKGPLADRLEYAILKIIMDHNNETHQEYWGPWMNSVSNLVPELAHESDLKAAFKRLREDGRLGLSKAAEGRRHGFEYSGNESDDEAFFFTGSFNATITDDGRKYWDGIKVKPRSAAIGF